MNGTRRGMKADRKGYSNQNDWIGETASSKVGAQLEEMST
jgi:hypothetical protein